VSAHPTGAVENSSSEHFQCYTPTLVKIMPSSITHWLDSNLSNALHLAGILVIALVLNRLLRALTNLVIKQASGQGRPAQLREQQTRTLAGVLYGAGSKVVWLVALLTALHEFNIDITPAVTLAVRSTNSGSRRDHRFLYSARRPVRCRRHDPNRR